MKLSEKLKQLSKKQLELTEIKDNYDLSLSDSDYANLLYRGNDFSSLVDEVSQTVEQDISETEFEKSNSPKLNPEFDVPDRGEGVSTLSSIFYDITKDIVYSVFTITINYYSGDSEEYSQIDPWIYDNKIVYSHSINCDPIEHHKILKAIPNNNKVILIKEY